MDKVSDIISKFEFNSNNIKNTTPIKTNSSSNYCKGENIIVMSNEMSSTKLCVENEKKLNITKTTNHKTFVTILSWLPLPFLSTTGTGIFCLIASFFLPKTIGKHFLYPGFRLLFGKLYPAYASYKAVRSKNVKEYVKWMMYWIVFALFSFLETFTDIFLSWFPFYYEVKVIIVIWLLSPATKGSSTLYRKFVHPMLTRREEEIDEYINQAKEKGYTAVLQLGSKGVNYATSMIMQTAIKGGGNLVSTLRKSYSLSDLSEPDVHNKTLSDNVDAVIMRPQRILRPRTQSNRSSSSSGRGSGTSGGTAGSVTYDEDMYFPEINVASGSKDQNDYSYGQSIDDISSGYGSLDPLPGVTLSRTSSMTNATKTRLKSKKTEELNFSDYELLLSDPKLIQSLIKKYPILTKLVEIDNGENNIDYVLEEKESLPSSSSSPENSAKFKLFCNWLNDSSHLDELLSDKVEEKKENEVEDDDDDEFLDSTDIECNSDIQGNLPTTLVNDQLKAEAHIFETLVTNRPATPPLQPVSILEPFVDLSLTKTDEDCCYSVSDLTLNVTKDTKLKIPKHNKGQAPTPPALQLKLLLAQSPPPSPPLLPLINYSEEINSMSLSTEQSIFPINTINERVSTELFEPSLSTTTNSKSLRNIPKETQI